MCVVIINLLSHARQATSRGKQLSRGHPTSARAASFAEPVQENALQAQLCVDCRRFRRGDERHENTKSEVSARCTVDRSQLKKLKTKTEEGKTLGHSGNKCGGTLEQEIHGPTQSFTWGYRVSKPAQISRQKPTQYF